MNRVFADQEKNINFVMELSRFPNRDKKLKLKIKIKSIKL